jgi:hypothetical protein
MAIVSDANAPGFERKPGESYREYDQRTDALLKEMLERAAALPEGEYVGAVLSFPIADGKAMYVVEKTEPLTLQHIPYMDAYEIPAAHARGLDLTDVQAHIQHQKALNALFSRKRA